MYVLVTFIHYFCCCFFFAAKAKQSKRKREQQQQKKNRTNNFTVNNNCNLQQKNAHTHKIFVSHAYHTDTRLYNRTNIFFLSLFNNVHHLWKWYAVPSMPLTHNVCLHSVICVCRQKRGRKRNRVREKGGERKIERNAVGRTELKVVF